MLMVHTGRHVLYYSFSFVERLCDIHQRLLMCLLVQDNFLTPTKVTSVRTEPEVGVEEEVEPEESERRHSRKSTKKHKHKKRSEEGEEGEEGGTTQKKKHRSHHKSSRHRSIEQRD
jgi:hypothetical protein